MNEESFDLVVVGGGPGGSTVATLVAKRGYTVLLLERERFPRYQIGESLLPATIQGICRLLGVKEEVDKAGFVPKKGGTFRWGTSLAPWTFFFDQRVDGVEPRATAYQVERAKFDHILLKNAAAKGVTVREGCRVERVIHAEDGSGRVVGLVYRDDAGRERRVTARYVADASGNSSKICGEVGERIYSEEFNNIAIYTYFDNAKRLPKPNSGNILCCAFEDGWFWFIPLSDTLTSVGVVVDRSVMAPGAKLEDIYYGSIDKTPLIKSYLEGATRRSDEVYGRLRVRKDYSYTTTRLWKPGLVLIGDAACFVDPVFSSGVHLATYSALCAARSINTYFAGELTEQDCMEEFERRYRIEFGNFYNFLLAFYDTEQHEEKYFWTARKILGTREPPSTSFIRLVAGYSTDGIEPSDDPRDFFRHREGIGRQIVEKQLMGSSFEDDEPGRQIDGKKFMEGFTREVKNLQAQAHGFVLGEANANRSSRYTVTADFLGWAEYAN